MSNPEEESYCHPLNVEEAITFLYDEEKGLFNMFITPEYTEPVQIPGHLVIEYDLGGEDTLDSRRPS